jgi:hypothetical protein
VFKRKRKRSIDNKSTQRPKSKRRKLTPDKKVEIINRFKKPNLADLYLGLHGITKTPINKKYESHIPDKHSSNVENLISRYQSDFIFRLLYYPKQLMFIAKQMKFGGSMIDPVLDGRTNDLQIRLFKTCKNNILESMVFPKGSDKRASPELISILSNSLTNHVIMSRSTYHFRYVLLNLIKINENIRELVKQMIPPLNFSTLMFILENILQTKYSVGVENQIHEENNTNIIIETILTISWAYPMNFGLFIEEGKEPIRLGNSLHKLQQQQ